MLEPKAAPHVFETAAHGKRGRSQDSALQFVEQAGLQNRRYINRCSLQVDVEFVAPTTPPLDPEDSIWIFRFHQESQLHLQFLRTSGKVEDFLRLGRKIFQFRSQSGKRLLQRHKLLAVFL